MAPSGWGWGWSRSRRGELAADEAPGMAILDEESQLRLARYRECQI